ncbi:hypothetical protein [Exiguobacterium acetylicum]|uniref:hypothetical protein n=1 Tax=Exiguobacterium acetylicum TaxID=41170 RepID=UPI00068331C5|nr:hypothetical protein [Exiguobacterium acetylicum]KNH34142.1 hypothetical protein ACS74_10475 [Exiguobacterium acetylicum]
MYSWSRKVRRMWLKFGWIVIIACFVVIVGSFVLIMNGNPIKEKEIGKRLEVDLEREYKTKFDLEYTRYDATRSEYGAIFHTNEPDKKDDVSFYATYHNDYELYDTYREEIWSRDIRKAVSKEAKEVYGNNFIRIAVNSPPELFIDDVKLNNVLQYTELSEESMRCVQIMVNVHKEARHTVKKDLAKLVTKMKDGSMKAGKVIVMGADDEKATAFRSWVWIDVTNLPKDFKMSEFNKLLEWDQTFTSIK